MIPGLDPWPRFSRTEVLIASVLENLGQGVIASVLENLGQGVIASVLENLGRGVIASVLENLGQGVNKVGPEETNPRDLRNL